MELNPKDASLFHKICYRILLVSVTIVFICGDMFCYPFRKIKKLYKTVKGNYRLKRDGIIHLVDRK
jgi:hypothetical protein